MQFDTKCKIHMDDLEWDAVNIEWRPHIKVIFRFFLSFIYKAISLLKPQNVFLKEFILFVWQ